MGPGPFSTKKFPVRRCPYLRVKADGTLGIHAKTYRQGHGLAAIETIHDRSMPPTPLPVIKKQPVFNPDHPAMRDNIAMGGCQTKLLRVPPSGHRFHDTYIPDRSVK